MSISVRSAVSLFLLGFVAFFVAVAALAASGRSISFPFAQPKYALGDTMCAPTGEEGGQIYFVSCGGID